MTQDSKANAISAAMHGLEDGVDLEIGQAAHLMGQLVEYRIDNDMDAAAGQKALARMADAQKHLIEARMKVVAAHASVAEAFEKTHSETFTCPDTQAELQNDNVTKLELVNG
ncbi:MAG: hypothetical protein ABJP34_01400 [Erythrobacter sp.]